MDDLRGGAGSLKRLVHVLDQFLEPRDLLLAARDHQRVLCSRRAEPHVAGEPAPSPRLAQILPHDLERLIRIDVLQRDDGHLLGLAHFRPVEFADDPLDLRELHVVRFDHNLIRARRIGYRHRRLAPAGPRTGIDEDLTE